MIRKSSLTKEDQMTKKEYFDLLVSTSEAGNFPAIEGSKQCKYRAPNGNKCAFGLLIPDGLYDPSMEGSTAQYLLRKYPSLQEIVKDIDQNIIEEVQALHDKMAWEKPWNHAEFVHKLKGIFSS